MYEITMTDCNPRVIDTRTGEEIKLNSVIKLNKVNKKSYHTYMMKWYETHKKEVNMKRQIELVRCVCGRVVRRVGLKDHMKRKLHDKTLALIYDTQ